MTDHAAPAPFWMIGCGNMAGAMLAGWLEAGADPGDFTVIRPSGEVPAAGVRTLTAPPASEAPALVLLGIKPQKLDEVAPVIAPLLRPETILVPILAGVELASLRDRFPAPRTIVRAMPNTPVALCKGVTNLVTNSADLQARASVERLMAALGHVEWFDDEERFALAGHLSAAGPAFFYRFLDALAAAGAELGLDAAQSARLAAAMAQGAATLAATSGVAPSELARRVASPGGTTEAGLRILDEEQGLRALMLRTLDASRRRGLEMAEAARRTD
jgi:pyrroline-5-carboxylate reductase